MTILKTQVLNKLNSSKNFKNSYFFGDGIVASGSGVTQLITVAPEDLTL